MAYTNIHTNAPASAEPFMARVSRGFDAFITRMASFSSANKCLKEVERLNRMSDADLAARGIKRDEIVLHAFRSYNYI